MSGDILSRLVPAPSGFGNCVACAYRDTGNVAVCYACARQNTTALAQVRCRVCDQALPTPTGLCRNPVCNWPDRQFEWSRAIAVRGGQLERAIKLYKFDGIRGWATIFGRVLAGFLDEQAQLTDSFDMIIASPTYVGHGGREFDHTYEVVKEAARLNTRNLPFADQVVIEKTAPSKRLTKCDSWAERRTVCDNEVRPALSVPEPPLINGRRILVYDDVFTDGLNLNTVASVLRENGAANVCGVVLARQPWTGRSSQPPAHSGN